MPVKDEVFLIKKSIKYLRNDNNDIVDEIVGANGYDLTIDDEDWGDEFYI